MATEEIKNVRTPGTKPFTTDKRQLDFKKYWEDMLDDKYYKQSYLLYNKCIDESTKFYAASLNKLLDEDAEALDKMGADYGEALSKLVNNRCQKLGVSQIFSSKTRYRNAEVEAEKHLKVELRSLANGGVRFNPYL